MPLHMTIEEIKEHMDDPAWVEQNRDAIIDQLMSYAWDIGLIWDQARGVDPDEGPLRPYGATPNRKSMTYEMRKAAGYSYP